MINKRLGRLGILLSLTMSCAGLSLLSGCSTKHETRPILVFDEDTILRTAPNEPCPVKPYVMFHMSGKKLKELTDPR